MQRLWAWIWVAGLAIVGWLPALVVSYVIAFAIGIVARGIGGLIFGVTYLLMLAAGFLLLLQVNRFYGFLGRESRRFRLIGGGALLLAWGGAYIAFAIQAGWL